jgi:integrase
LQVYVFPIIGPLDVSKVDSNSVLAVLEQPHGGTTLWSSVPKTARELRQRIERVLDFAAARNYRRKGDNPASRRFISDALPKPTKKVVHHAALPFAALPEFMAALRSRPGIPARALEITVLCATRSSETLKARWSEFDLTERLWTIPGSRMKAGVEHVIPLSDRCIEILQSLPREDDNPLSFVFPGLIAGQSLGTTSLATVLERMGYDHCTVHGFRSSFMDWAHETTNFAKVTIDKSLAHVIPDETEAAYRRGNLLLKRRALMNAWAKFASAPAADKPGRVIPLVRVERPKSG